MGDIRKRHSATLKAKVALEDVKEATTLAELANEFAVHPNQIRQWKHRLVEEAPTIFSTRQDKEERAQEALQTELYRQIGQLKVELDWLQNKSARLG